MSAVRSRSGARRQERHDQRERCDGDPKELERGPQSQWADNDAASDRRKRERGVGGDIEGRHHRGSVLGGDDRGQGAQRAEERDPEAGAADDRADEIDEG